MEGPSTICPHNAVNQPLLPGQPTVCRMCNAPIEPAAGSPTTPNPGALRAAYPSEAKA